MLHRLTYYTGYQWTLSLLQYVSLPAVHNLVLVIQVRTMIGLLREILLPWDGVQDSVLDERNTHQNSELVPSEMNARIQDFTSRVDLCGIKKLNDYKY